MLVRVLILLAALGQFAQSNTGELRLAVTDPDNLPLESSVALVNEAGQIAQHFETSVDGELVAKRLPFGRYRLEVSRDGFATYTTLVDIQSAIPLERHVVLNVAPVQAQVTVNPADTLIDRRQSGSVNQIGLETIQRQPASLPGRSMSSLVDTQPGWLLEANGVLHPRGSEYQVQFVVDGLPLTDNRSPAFAPELDADDARGITILTGGYPAEYGRKLGGVVEVVTSGIAQQGVHGTFNASAGSFATGSGSAGVEYARNGTTIGVSGSASDTDRYLDPPVEQNFTNHGTTGNAAVRIEHDFSVADRIGAILRHGQTRFLAPNEQVQEDAGQRQERTASETNGQASYQHVFGERAVFDIRGMARTLGAGLTSNAASTPIAAQQDRGLGEGYLKATVAAKRGAHEWKAGIDAEFANVRESFSYHITDPRQFDRDTPRDLAFADRQPDREQALFVQDRWALSQWTVNAGVRWDHYRLLVEKNAFSPRIGVAWAWPGADLVVRASYDRAFQTPAVENLLLASSPAVESLSDNVVRLPVLPSTGNFYEVAMSTRLLGRLRLDATYFDREMTNFADDDVLLNTGVSFPIAFSHASVRGTELKLDLPSWRALSGSINYTNTIGVGTLPITGGLLLGDDAAASLVAGRFPISQDQRNTIRGRGSYQLTRRAWLATSIAYGSGLPVEFNGTEQQAIAQFGQRIVDRVDFERGRVRPSLSLDLSGSVVILQRKGQVLRVQADVLNVTDRLNLINFAGLFSGTAIAPPRSFAVRLQGSF